MPTLTIKLDLGFFFKKKYAMKKGNTKIFL